MQHLSHFNQNLTIIASLAPRNALFPKRTIFTQVRWPPVTLEESTGQGCSPTSSLAL